MPIADSSPIPVFISYSHDSPEHQRRVLDLSDRLRSDGIDAWIDQYTPWPEEGWPRRMGGQMRDARFVLMVCTESYLRRVTGQEEPGAGRGVCWEAHLVYNDLYHAKISASKYVPIVFSAADAEHIPPILQGHAHFCLDTDQGYWQLYRLLTDQPEVEPGKLGTLKKLSRLAALSPTSTVPSVPGASIAAVDAVSSARIFISYPHGDADEENLARFLHTQFSDLGHDVFIDVGMKAGSDWVEEIRARIQWCDHLVVLLSERSMYSEMLQAEVRAATLRQRQTGTPTIIPLRVRYFGSLEYELDLYLRNLQYVRWTGPQDNERVRAEILRAMSTDQIAPATVDQPESPPTSRLDLGERRPSAARDARPASELGGTIKHTDPYYIHRLADEVVIALAAEQGHTLVIKGPRQMGKSSLLIHYLVQSQKAGKKIAFVDFQMFSQEDLEAYPKFLSRFAMILSQRLRLDLPEAPTIGTQFAMVDFMERVILPRVGGPLVVALDEADRLFRTPYKADFFSMLRLWHNNRVPLTPEWEVLDLALVISTEPYLLIDQGDRSPFNVGRLLELEPFARDECGQLNRNYGGLLSEQEIEQLWTLLRGHPYLTRLAYYRLTAPDRCGFEELWQRADDERGPFGDHLRALLMKLHERPELLAAMKQAIRTGTVDDPDLYWRLYGAGLVRREGQRIDPANLLYARFFKNAL